VAPYKGTQNLSTGPPVGTVEVRLAAEFMDRFGRARSDTEIRSSWREISEWSHFKQLAHGGSDSAVAWHWLVRVAQVAKEHADIMLPAKVLGCARFWDWRARQYAEIHDFAAAVQLPTAGRDTQVRLAAIALSCLLALPADTRVMHCQAGPYTASGLAMYAVNIILSYNERYSLPTSLELDSILTPGLAALARDVWAGRVGHARWA
jgi:hypothetical protein